MLACLLSDSLIISDWDRWNSLYWWVILADSPCVVDLCAIDQQLCQDENSLLSFEAICSVHKLMDDDADGTVDTAETDEVRRTTHCAHWSEAELSQTHASDAPSSVSQGGPEVSRLQGQTQQLPPSRPAHQRGGHVDGLEELWGWGRVAHFQRCAGLTRTRSFHSAFSSET